jgi:hypothetical protein
MPDQRLKQNEKAQTDVAILELLANSPQATVGRSEFASFMRIAS